ncbi:hypothetical protein LTR05_002422 [Lithohypha guttulata]|uniref:Uncharacterized protein n=1 Tax=Lithohypha guttulata TaxID=1690604 RepID=A0AAN7T2L8_9EURO|nr:hypothetical protein LTR05_002422 [Lithohypha guttulata]
MTQDQRTVLITGCSDGSLGAALAHAFHEKRLRVFATARDLNKMSSLKEASIECFELDVRSDESIKKALIKVSSLTDGLLDIVVNNAGGGHYMPFLHLDLNDARDLFETNVWSYLAVTQAFLPLLMKNAQPTPTGKKSLIVNNTSISSVLRTPYHSAYGASKAAMAAFNDAQRIELSPFGIRVVDLKTGSLSSNFKENKTNPFELPADSPYQPIKDEVLNVITGNVTESYAENQTSWAKNVVADLLKDPNNPPANIWRGGSAGTVKLSNSLDNVTSADTGDSQFQKLGGLEKLEKILAERASADS